MKNFVAVGNSITVFVDDIILGGSIIGGNGYLMGGIFGVAADSATATDIDDGTSVVLNLTGIYDLPKQPSQVWVTGAQVYWDSDNERCTTTASGNTLIGVAVQRTGGTAGETIGRVRLNGAAV